MDLEEMYSVLLGASGKNGAKFDVVHRWFIECKIIDGKVLNEHIFQESFERLAPNREDLSLTKFVQFMGILARETRQEVPTFLERFRTVQNDIVDEIQDKYKREGKKHE